MASQNEGGPIVNDVTVESAVNVAPLSPLCTPIQVLDGRAETDGAVLKDVTDVGNLVCRRVETAMMNVNSDIFIPINYVEKNDDDLKTKLLANTNTLNEMNIMIETLMKRSTTPDVVLPVASTPVGSVVDGEEDETIGVVPTAATFATITNLYGFSVHPCTDVTS